MKTQAHKPPPPHTHTQTPVKRKKVKGHVYLFLASLPVIDQVVSSDADGGQPGEGHQHGQKVRPQEVDVTAQRQPQ